MYNIIRTLAVLGAALSLILISLPQELHAQRGPGKGILSQLNDEQKAELKSTVEQLRESGASRTEVHATVQGLLKGWGIDPMERRGGFWTQLNDGQKTELKSMIEQMRADGAIRPEIREAVHEKLKAWGIEAGPRVKDGRGRHGMGRGCFCIGDKLSEAQRTEIHEMVQRMKRDGAERPEIREAVQDKLKTWGIAPGKEEARAVPSRETAITDVKNFPNPFNPGTSISYTLKTAGDVRADLYTMNGELVKSIFNGRQETGAHTLTWNGTNDNGQTVASGTYMLRISTGSDVRSIPISFTK